MEVTVDSSVIVAAFVTRDPYSPEGREVLARHFDGKYVNVSSITVPIEVSCSIARRAGDALAQAAASELKRWEELGFMRFEELTRERAEQALQLGVKLKLKGMDAVIVSVAQEGSRPLITFDAEMARRAAPEVKVMTSSDFRS